MQRPVKLIVNLGIAKVDFKFKIVGLLKPRTRSATRSFTAGKNCSIAKCQLKRKKVEKEDAKKLLSITIKLQSVRGFRQIAFLVEPVQQ